MKKNIVGLVAALVFLASIASLVYAVNKINTKGRYLDLAAYYPCKDVTGENGNTVNENEITNGVCYENNDADAINKNKNTKNTWIFQFDKSEEYASYVGNPTITIVYKDDLVDKWLNPEKARSNFVEEDDVDSNFFEIAVQKDGYVFKYLRLNHLDSNGVVYWITFKIGDYRFDLYDLDKGTGEMAEFCNTYKSADDCITAIKKLEPVAKKMIDEATGRYNTMLLVAVVSAVCLATSGTVLVLFFVRRKAINKQMEEQA